MPTYADGMAHDQINYVFDLQENTLKWKWYLIVYTGWDDWGTGLYLMIAKLRGKLVAVERPDRTGTQNGEI
jgi:hypothetical protein